MVAIIYSTLTSLSSSFWGKMGSMQAAGSFTLTCIVIVSNIKLLISSFEITPILIILVALSIIIYLIAFWFITWYSPEADDYGVFIELFTFFETYALLYFFMTSYVLIDIGMSYTSMEINAIMERRKARAIYETKLKELKKKGSSVKTRITTIVPSK